MNNLELKKKTKRILFVSHNLEPEGATWSLFYLVKGFKRLGYEVSVISPQDGPLTDFYKNEGVDVSVFDFFSRTCPRQLLMDVDVFFVNTILGYKFIKNLNVEKNKIVWCIRESEREVYFNKYADLKKEFFSEVARVVFVAKSTMEIYGDMERNNFVTIYNGLDLGKINAFIKKNSKQGMRRKYGIADTDLIFCIVGAVCLRKGQLEFTQAAIKLLNKTRNRKLKFLIIGGRDSLYERRINEIIQESGYAENIKIIKESLGAYEYFLMSDFFVCNSYIESFPRVVLEAMAFNLPIIATDVYGISEQIENKKEGILIMAGDVAELFQKMKWMLENKNNANELANNARKKVEKDFSFEIMLEKYETLIKNICVE
ncbi:MAG: glycosyltransferase family 4 protein [Candidatus Moraniibacteriota bacterium]